MNWEYTTIKLAPTGFLGGAVDDTALEEMLNELGGQGWELTTAFDTSQAYGRTRDVVMIFKRPRA